MLDAEPMLSTLPASFRAGHAHEAGLTHRVLQRLVRSGRITRSGHGVYRQQASVADTSADGALAWEIQLREHRHRCAEALLRFPGHAVSHLSAALLHGLPVLLQSDLPVELTSIDRAAQSRRRRGLVLHHCDSLENETESLDGLRVTVPARTLADVARQHPPTVSVPLLDAAGRSGRAALGDVEDVLHGQVRWTGRSRGYRAVALADIRRESWLESYSFVVLGNLGLPMPTPQVEVHDGNGDFVARVDGMLLDEAVVLECDGTAKYSISAGQTVDLRTLVTRELMAQNRRQLRLEALGLGVVRWSTPEITTAAPRVLDRIQHARRAASASSFSGRLRVNGIWWSPAGLSAPRTPNWPNHPVNGQLHDPGA